MPSDQRIAEIEARPSTWYCNKCGCFRPDGPIHDGCNYLASDGRDDERWLIEQLRTRERDLTETRRLLVRAKELIGAANKSPQNMMRRATNEFERAAFLVEPGIAELKGEENG